MPKKKKPLPPISDARRAIFEKFEIPPDRQIILHERLETATVADKDQWGQSHGIPYQPTTLDEIEKWGDQFIENHLQRCKEYTQTISNLLEALQPHRDAIQRASHVYQYEEKLEAARAYNKPLAYFNVAYKRWQRYQKLLKRRRAYAEQQCSATGHTGPFCDSPIYRQIMGMDNKVAWE